MSGTKRHPLSFFTDCLIIRKLEEGVKPEELAKLYNVKLETINEIRECKDVFTTLAVALLNGPTTPLMFNENSAVTVNEIYSWLRHQCKILDIFIPCELLHHRAKLHYKKMVEKIIHTDKRADDEWVDGFIKKHGIELLLLLSKDISEEQLANTNNNTDQGNSESQNNDNGSKDCKVTHDEAIASFNKCVAWSEDNGLLPDEMRLLKSLRDKVLACKPDNANKQS